VLNITKSDMPSDFITDSLITLVEHGNYFTGGLLWDCEVEKLDFNRYITELPVFYTWGKLTLRPDFLHSLGGTRNMVPPADADPAVALSAKVGSGKDASSAYATNVVTLSVEEEVSIGGASGATTMSVYANRVRLLLQNFLLLRTLVGHVLLGPWHCSLCAPPSLRATKRVLFNHRILATAMYGLLRKLDPSLPTVPESTMKIAQPSQADKFIMPRRPANAAYVLGDAMVAAAQRAQQLTPSPSVILLPSNSTATAARISTPSVEPGRAKSPRVGTAGRSARGASESATGATTTSTDDKQQPASQAEIATADKKDTSGNSMLFKLSKLIGMSDITTPGQEAAPTQGSVESTMLEQREDFPTQAQLMELLIPPSQLAPMRVYWEEWFAELRGPLDAWLQRLVVHVLTRRLKQRLEREAKEAAGAAGVTA
jgi:hypothetical protein